MNYFSRNIKFLREEKNLKQGEMQSTTGIKGATWSNYELGKTEPSIDVIILISKFFKIGLSDLIEKNLQNVHLIENFYEAKKAENVNLNVNPIVHPSPQKEVKYPPEHTDDPAFNYSLNEDQVPYISLKHELLNLSTKVAGIEANIDKRLSQMEDKINSLAKGKSKM